MANIFNKQILTFIQCKSTKKVFQLAHTKLKETEVRLDCYRIFTERFSKHQSMGDNNSYQNRFWPSISGLIRDR